MIFHLVCLVIWWFVVGFRLIWVDYFLRSDMGLGVVVISLVGWFGFSISMLRDLELMMVLGRG